MIRRDQHLAGIYNPYQQLPIIASIIKPNTGYYTILVYFLCAFIANFKYIVYVIYYYYYCCCVHTEFIIFTEIICFLKRVRLW